LESVFTVEPPVSVKTVLVEFKTHASAIECQSGGNNCIYICINIYI
jgi:hypothetical protein